MAPNGRFRRTPRDSWSIAGIGIRRQVSGRCEAPVLVEQVVQSVVSHSDISSRASMIEAGPWGSCGAARPIGLSLSMALSRRCLTKRRLRRSAPGTFAMETRPRRSAVSYDPAMSKLTYWLALVVAGTTGLVGVYQRAVSRRPPGSARRSRTARRCERELIAGVCTLSYVRAPQP